ncbi:SCP2 sterol-binding domain-containing protein [Salinisphaera sp. USBA-960]|uniref:SCP2 sterol-binding domain-containing protein n=1 Tax=Salinisphaera orenii TaxID=856731 RepID=UPI000DBE569F|nr:SCP2 sterol-binding domain-containing protein [Salifodinibacter halophilus]NNC25877.1 SCP2 sterol-binding domain-containing protein [Salifodinibacter halophilus]
MHDANTLIRRMPKAFKPEAAGSMSLRIVYAIDAPMTVIVEHGVCQVMDGAIESPDVVLRIRDKHLIKLMTGRMMGLTAFATGKLKVDGDYTLAAKIQHIFDREKLTD